MTVAYNKIAAMVAATMSLFSAAIANTLVAEIPFRYDYEGWITVPVIVNDEGPYDFIIDSGATLTVVFENLGMQQDFPFVGGELRRILGLIESNDLPPQYIGDLTIGGQPLPDLTSVVIADWELPKVTPQGVLGLDFLAQYVVEIDPDAGLVRLYRDGPPAKVKTRGWTRVSMDATLFDEYAKPLYTVEAKIGGVKYPFILDLGAAGTLINYPAARKLFKLVGLNINDYKSKSRIPKVQDLFGNEDASRLIRIRRMKIGNRRLSNQVITVYNAQVFEELGIANEPYGLLGADILRGSPLVLDFPDNRLYIRKPRKKSETRRDSP